MEFKCIKRYVFSICGVLLVLILRAKMKYEVYILPFSIVVVVYFWTSSFVVRTSKIHIVLVQRDKWIEKKVSCPALTIFVKSITPYWFCTGFQLAGTPSTLHSKHSSPPCTSICPHHPQSFPAQGSTLFWNLSDKIKLIKEIGRDTKIQV